MLKNRMAEESLLYKILEEKFPEKISLLKENEKNFINTYFDFDKQIEMYEFVVAKLLDLNEEDYIPKYFFDNILNSFEVNPRKLEFGNEKHIAIINGWLPFSEDKNLYKNMSV